MKLIKQHYLTLVIIALFAISPLQVVSQSKSYDFFSFQQIKTDTLFESKQIISILSLPLANNGKYVIEIAYSETELKPTSTFAEEENAIAAINASFFDMKNSGSVTYLEENNSMIAPAGPLQLPDSLLNGVVIFTKDNKLKFELKKPDRLYLKSRTEKVVIGTGPLLLAKGHKLNMPEKKRFVAKRHPRTCLCTTTDSLLLITVDGRSQVAEGMSLYELQDFLISIKCLEAINLDGGGSTTMWIKDKGVVNYPSDKTGERKVANVVVIKEIGN